MMRNGLSSRCILRILQALYSQCFPRRTHRASERAGSCCVLRDNLTRDTADGEFLSVDALAGNCGGVLVDPAMGL